MSDIVLRVLAANTGLRLLACTSTELTKEAAHRHETSPIATAALGYGLTAGALLGASWTWILILSCLSLALSAWVRWRPVAQLFLLGMLTVPTGFARAVNEILELDRDWAVLFSPTDLLTVTRAGLFGDTVHSWAYIDLPDLPLASAWLAVALLCAACLLLLTLKVKAFEVVR